MSAWVKAGRLELCRRGVQEAAASTAISERNYRTQCVPQRLTSLMFAFAQNLSLGGRGNCSSDSDWILSNNCIVFQVKFVSCPNMHGGAGGGG